MLAGLEHCHALALLLYWAIAPGRGGGLIYLVWVLKFVQGDFTSERRFSVYFLKLMGYNRIKAKESFISKE